MCIAILNKGKKLTKQELTNCWDNNNDGGGIMYAVNGKLSIKTFPYDARLKNFGLDNLINEYNKARKKVGAKGIISLHFRISTSGHNNSNLHPFAINENLGMIHNGVISGIGGKKKSDTNIFRYHLKNIGCNTIEKVKSPAYSYFINEAIGVGNKLVFLDNNSNYAIVNEKTGHWNDKGWFSNDSYNECDYYYAGNTKVYKNIDSYDDAWNYHNRINSNNAKVGGFKAYTREYGQIFDDVKNEVVIRYLKESDWNMLALSPEKVSELSRWEFKKYLVMLASCIGNEDVNEHMHGLEANDFKLLVKPELSLTDKEFDKMNAIRNLLTFDLDRIDIDYDFDV